MTAKDNIHRAVTALRREHIRALFEGEGRGMSISDMAAFLDRELQYSEGGASRVIALENALAVALGYWARPFDNWCHHDERLYQQCQALLCDTPTGAASLASEKEKAKRNKCWADRINKTPCP